MNDSTGLRSVTTLNTPRTRCESRLNNKATIVARHATQHKAKKGLDFAEALFYFTWNPCQESVINSCAKPLASQA